MTTDISASVGFAPGRRVANRSRDQDVIISLLSRIPGRSGGRKEAWPAPPLSGPEGQCPSFLSDAITRFQQHWKVAGVLRVVDGVADPNGSTHRQLKVAAGVAPAGAAPGPARQAVKIIRDQPRIQGAWQILGASAITLGEVGQVGTVELDIGQPDGRKMKLTGIGAGFGLSVDPVSYLKLFKVPVKEAPIALKQVAKMLALGVGFNIGDYLGLFGQSLGSLSATGGRIIANPMNGLVGRPQAVSRQLLGGGSAPPPFMIISAGGGIGAGMEGGIISFGMPPGLGAPAWAIYGTSGVTAKFGAGVQGLLYHSRSLVDVP